MSLSYVVIPYLMASQIIKACGKQINLAQVLLFLVCIYNAYHFFPKRGVFFTITAVTFDQSN